MDRTDHLDPGQPRRADLRTWTLCTARTMVAVLAGLALLLGVARPAAAQDTTLPGGETTTPSDTNDTPATETTATETTATEATATETTATAQGPTTTSASSTTASTVGPETTTSPTSSAEQPTTVGPETETSLGESEVDPLDPMSNEAPGEEAPGTDVTVPPKTTYNGQEPFKPAEILWSSVAAAERKLDEAVADKRSAIVHVRSLRKRFKELDTATQSLATETADAIDEVERAEERLSARAVLGYQRFGSGSDTSPLPEVSDQQGILDVRRRSKMVSSALDADEADLDQLATLRAALGSDARQVLDRKRLVIDIMADAESVVTDLDHEIDQATIEYEAFKAGSEIFIHGVQFPIAGAYSTPLIDSYGFPRMPGTPDEHWHEGIDLFADKGAPLVATERGVITKLGVGRLGGLKFWLKGESGTEWYYAHLDGFAPGMADGVVVEAGQLLGYVGNTGNALTTPPHLHMQVHPDGGEPVNPYPLLKVVSDLELAAIAAGIHPGYEHSPKISGN